uniref:Putative oxidoreductase n=1 Tax=Pithovirus LCPAC202 TaxID=2506592 RepID=A0A481Z7X5_9VIRU|nr:MAG: putative oxidoreductase [Pithovirus LCPAC202]
MITTNQQTTLLDHKRTFDRQGWVIIPGLLSDSNREALKTEMIKTMLDTVFTRRGVNIDTNNPENLKLLTDPKLRKRTLSNPGGIWRNNNTRDPIVGKTTGMINIHFNAMILEKIALNPSLYQVLSTLYGKINSETGQLQPMINLVHSEGPERFSIKAKGSTKMPQHIDANLFYPEVNYPLRIQSFYCVNTDSQINPSDSGTIAVLDNFCFYFALLGGICHPRYGIHPFPENKSRFFSLPKKFDSEWLPKLNQIVKLYTEFFHRGVVSTDQRIQTRFEQLKKSGRSVPNQFMEMKWKVIRLQPGDFFCWSQCLPHYSCRNKSETPRMVCYYSLYPVSNTWYNSYHNQWTKEMFLNRIFYYSTNAGECLKKTKNPEEYQYLKTLGDENLTKYQNWIKSDPLRAKLTGLESWFPSTTQT